MKCAACGSEAATGASCPVCGTPAVAIIPGTRLAGRYEIQTLIASGALGRVFRAHDLTLNEIVAIKVLHPETTQSAELTQRFRNEIRLARRVRHVNVCAIHEYGEDGPLQFVAMEFVDGVDLQRALRESGPLPAAEVFDVALQMARGLAAIHEAGVIHRDLKTSNIVRDPRGAVRLLDFGIAKRSSSTGTLALTGGERVVGTPEYMSPEQIRGGELDPRSDLYSFGVVLFELSTGTLPFEGKTPLDTMLRQVSEPPPLYGERASRISPPLVSLLRRLLAKDPAGRPAAARDLENELLFARAAAFPGTAFATPAAPPLPTTTSAVPAPAAAAPAPFVSHESPKPSPEPADRTQVLPRRPSLPVRPTPPPPPLVAARDAAAAAALDGERTYIELPVLSNAPGPALLPPPVPQVGSAPPRPVSALPGVALLAVVGLAAIGLALAVRARRGSEEDKAPAPRAQDARPDATAAAAQPQGGTPQVASPVAQPVPQPVPPPVAQPVPQRVPPPAAPQKVRAASAPAAVAVAPAASPSLPRSAAATPVPAETLTATPPPAPGVAPTPLPRGQLSIDVRPRAEVEIDGRPYGPVPLAELNMEPGEHSVELIHPEFWPRRLLVVLYPGSQLRLDVNLAWEGVRRASAPPYRLPGGSDPDLARAADVIAAMQWREAVATLEPLVRRLSERGARRGDLARAHFYLGVAHLELGEATRATQSFSAAIAQDSKLRPPAAAFPPRVLSFFNHVRSLAAARP